MTDVVYHFNMPCTVSLSDPPSGDDDLRVALAEGLLAQLVETDTSDLGEIFSGITHDPLEGLGAAADLLADLVPLVVSFEYPGFIFVQLDGNRQVSIGDNGDVGEGLGFQLDDNEGRNLDAFEIEGITIDNTPAEIAAGIAEALKPYLTVESAS